ncbi:L,D-transpeptidase [Azorhizobium oxalatiphilum]|uniref:L,D-transpeptidase n=1 Tax=Azorhizobium oxalatiphilum TaxID=980631 RepID=A0A917F484_9HYPH|nr:L,D-transpeptidase [Azorhizobium oxalatiphilum]GGF44561.1 L,D-transpeptidase [Azorhizobium oxalatiphilum]
MASPLALAGCMGAGAQQDLKPTVEAAYPSPQAIRMYAALPNERFPVPAPDLTQIEPQFLRQVVDYREPYMPGTVVIDTDARFLYLVRENQQALRYGIGVGKEGLEFEGAGVIQYKREWPRWTPTRDMMAREPQRYGHLGGGMEPGLANPLGARALYLFKGNVDTLYRIHGTNEDWSIGKAVSSGCIRLLNQDIIDLYGRVTNGTKVVVLQRTSLRMAGSAAPL